MLNLDTRLISADILDENEFWLLMHIVKRINAKRTCFPSNKVLMIDTKFGRDKVVKTKQSLEKKGFIHTVGQRKNKGKFSSNVYKVTTKLVKIFVEIGDLGDLEETDNYSADNVFSDNGKSDNGKHVHKVLPNPIEVLSKPKEVLPKEISTPFSNGKNKPKNKCEPQPIPTGLDTPDFIEAWAQLLETKKWRTKEASAVNLALKKLSAYDVAFAIQLVETATMGGYQGVVFSDTPTAYEKWQKTKQTSSQTFQQPHPNFPNRPLYVNSFADKWAKVKWWRTNLAELENGQDKEYSFTEISKMLQYTEPLNILK